MIWRLMPLLGFVLLAVVLFAGIQLSRDRAPGELPSVLIGKPAPAFTLDGLRDGEAEVSSAQFLGKPWLLNVWASWCAGCRVEHPVIEALAAGTPVVASDAIPPADAFMDVVRHQAHKHQDCANGARCKAQTEKWPAVA